MPYLLSEYLIYEDNTCISSHSSCIKLLLAYIFKSGLRKNFKRLTEELFCLNICWFAYEYLQFFYFSHTYITYCTVQDLVLHMFLSNCLWFCMPCKLPAYFFPVAILHSKRCSLIITIIRMVI